MTIDRTRLDKDLVTREALALLDEVGLNGLTLRRLADRLGVKAPALYWYVASKQELLDEMATAMMREMLADAPPAEGPWAAYIVRMATSLRAGLLRHRDGAKVFSGTYLTEGELLQSMEVPLRKLTEAGFPLRQAVWGYSTVYSYTIGFVIEEQATAGAGNELDPRYDPDARARRIDAARYPLTAAAGREAFASDPDARFRHGLDLIVAGMERSLRDSAG